MVTNTLYYRSPAQYWMDALPLGNGALGAMCYSGVGNSLLPFRFNNRPEVILIELKATAN